jgi:hypothetical protein
MAIQQRNLEALSVSTVLKPTSVATNNDTTGVDLSAFDGDALFVLSAVASGNDVQTINCKVQHAQTVDGTYADAPGGGFTILGNADVVQKVSVPRDELGPFFRLSFTDRATYTAVVGCVALGVPKYQS